MKATILTIVLEDGSCVYDLALSQDDNHIRISMGSLEGCEDVIAHLNNHMLDSLKVEHDSVKY